MQLRHVSTNLRQGLRRNMSMHAAVILTLFVSLTLAGIGVMLSKQAELTADVIGSELQVTVTLCIPDEAAFPQCTGEVTAEQEAVILDTIDKSPEVRDVEEVPREKGLQDLIDRGVVTEDQVEGPDPLITAENLPRKLRITLEEPDEYDGVISAIEDLDGVREVVPASELVGPIFTTINVLRYSAWGAAAVLVLAAVMLVANTIRLTALARRKEIEIMRLVGASRIFIALPFLLEAIFNAVVGVALTAGALAAFTQFGVIDGIKARFSGLPFVGWDAYGFAMLVVVVAGPLLTVLPTLLLTRKYLKY
ncbi:permease-like cell division protein FtsX [Nocardioides sp.]|uniref:permease-like cell division protein FtsX n=1 Tax=Nocardioides sp. TaxID=35761 RepID=UPI002726E11C|nr:permease-like cell division protein FtsX [Nocardioides sp.]MDO9457765.1 permease-like cell division protein FtsX [Nocardioides sp.]